MKPRSIFKHGEPELGEPFFTRKRLGEFHKRFVTEKKSPGLDNRTGTKNLPPNSARFHRVLP